MRGERWLLRAGEFLVGRAARRLPPEVRDECYREWWAELPAILHDPGPRPAWRRAARMLAYALDTIRGAALAPGQARYRGAHRVTDLDPATAKAARVLAARLAGLAAALAIVTAALAALLIYVTSASTGVGLWPAAGVSFLSILGCGLYTRLPVRWAFGISAVSTLLWASWQVYLAAIWQPGWPAGLSVMARLIMYGLALITTWGLIRVIARRPRIRPGRLRQWLRLPKT
ncbi:MAG: hypothetical protein ACRDPD_18810 [Streptosporangiaceae bacterium]